MKKKLLAILLGISAVAMLAACGADASGDASADASGDIVYDPLDYVTLGEYKGLSVEVTKDEVTEDDVKEHIKSLRKSLSSTYHATLDKETVEDGDSVNIDYVGTMDGEEFSGGTAQDQILEIGSDTFIDGFEDGLIGKKVGDTVTLDLTFPDPYENNEDLSGKAVTFEVTINKIVETETSTPKYTDEWIEEYTDGQYDNKIEFEAYVMQVLEEQEATSEENQILTSLQEQIYSNCSVSSLPEGLLDQYVQQQKEYDEQVAEQYGYTLEGYISAYYAGTYGLDMETEEDYIAYFTDYYQESLEKMLIREAIIKTEGYEVTEEATQKFFEDYAAAYGYADPESFLSAYYGVNSIDAFIEQTGEEQVNKSVLTNIMWDDLIAQANVTYVEASGDATASGDAE